MSSLLDGGEEDIYTALRGGRTFAKLCGAERETFTQLRQRAERRHLHSYARERRGRHLHSFARGRICTALQEGEAEKKTFAASGEERAEYPNTVGAPRTRAWALRLSSKTIVRPTSWLRRVLLFPQIRSRVMTASWFSDSSLRVLACHSLDLPRHVPTTPFLNRIWVAETGPRP